MEAFGSSTAMGPKTLADVDHDPGLLSSGNRWICTKPPDWSSMGFEGGYSPDFL